MLQTSQLTLSKLNMLITTECQEVEEPHNQCFHMPDMMKYPNSISFIDQSVADWLETASDVRTVEFIVLKNNFHSQNLNRIMDSMSVMNIRKNIQSEKYRNLQPTYSINWAKW